MGFYPIRIESGNLNGTDLPNIVNLTSYYNCKTSGFNLRVNVSCDITKVISDNINRFGRAFQYAIAIRLFTDAVNSKNINSTVSAKKNIDNWKEQIRILKGELYGGSAESPSGNIFQTKGFLNDVVMDMSDIDPVCLKAKDTFVKGYARI
jgi:hypothetical protein